MESSKPVAQVQIIEGSLLVPEAARFGIVAARFNSFIVERLLEGAVDGLLRHGARAENITAVRVPGSREVSVIVQRLARSKQFDAIVVVSCVIRGATAHFDYVAGDISRGVSSVMMETGLPIIFGVLTTDTIEQAVERAGTKAGNKGFDAAVAAIEMVTLGKTLSAAGL